MEKNKNTPFKDDNHAPGRGSDKQHPETPANANERFQKKEKGKVQENPGSQDSG
ncbi:MAG TPA: hypothetical protein VHM20_02245 [Gammaproteobacteria bacterium]|jgi:hypothetical protein|nr:hypothetical protein [Gammaproteobacteria bacterium]